MTFGDLALVGLAALLGPALSLVRPLRLPVVVGELAVGVAIGRTGAGWLSPAEPTFAFLAEVGFALVMFVAGTHVPLRSPVVRRGLAVGVARACVSPSPIWPGLRLSWPIGARTRAIWPF